MFKKYLLGLIVFVSSFITCGQAQKPVSGSTGFGHTNYNERMRCALFGAAAGDALGRITEFMPSKKAIYKKYPNGVNWFDDIFFESFTNVPNSILSENEDGERELAVPYVEINPFYPYTDDTVMMLIVLEELEKNYKNPDQAVDAMAERFVELFDPATKYIIDPLYDVRAHGLTNTRSCLEIVELMKPGKTWFGKLMGYGKTWRDRDGSFDRLSMSAAQGQASMSVDQAKLFAKITRETGCGSVMRVWPVGFYYHDNIELAIKVADMQSRITHRNPAACAACVAAAVGFAALCNGKNFDDVATAMIESAGRYDKEEKLYKKDAAQIAQACDGADKREQSCKYNLKLISQDRLLTSDMLRYAVWAAKNNMSPDVVLGIENDQASNYRSSSGALLGWRADEAIAAALYILMRHKDDFFVALSEAVNTPGDSDSIASLVGAFSGYAVGKSDVLFGKPHAQELENAKKIMGYKFFKE